ncbi:MAG: hypothetical protein KKC68_03155 [Candidatus Thermoplasmatota archaeon]|nr:hypothetical protein [Candidatus Thermoplasmatota archaeon]MBU1940750.1 hypothetical protein [Candidatus Thermoplasmatota archaeon]
MNNKAEIFCTFDLNASCTSCINHNKIFCKPDTNKVVVSHLLEFSYLTMAVFGVMVTSWILQFWLPTIFFIIFIPIFFIVFQARITCSHCPYYAESRRILHCTENHFTPKLWRYHPEPITRWEQIGTILCFTFLGAYPLFVELYGILTLWKISPTVIALLGALGIFLGTILTLTIFYLTFFMLYCPHCINFSCVFNKVPQKYVDEYLRRNPIIQQAWKNHTKKKT